MSRRRNPFGQRAGQKIMRGAMYVDVWVPDEIRQPYPIVMFHGNGQTAVDWMQTPDGRPGWAYYLVAQGYVLYMMDYPTRGRSAYVPGHDGNIGIRTGDQLEEIWTNVVERSDYYLKDNHTQGPGRERWATRPSTPSSRVRSNSPRPPPGWRARRPSICSTRSARR